MKSVERPDASQCFVGYESHSELIDLTHAFNSSTLYWPTSPSGFELKELSYGQAEGGYFYSAYSMYSPEHGARTSMCCDRGAS
jgi:hypothetical protein